MRTIRLLSVSLALAAAPPVAAASIADLAWLAGCWAAEGGEAGSEEHWLAPAGGTMLGVSRTVRQGKVVEHEFLEIREVEPGELVFTARPSGQAPVSFSLLRSSATEAVFENPAHDFPQRAIYRHEAGKLRARIEGIEDGRALVIDFPMQPATCPIASGKPES